MATHANVTSIDAIGIFRSRLIVFRTVAANALDEAAGEVRRVRQWIRQDRRFFWEAEHRRRQKRLDQALQDLMAARLSSLRDSTAAQQTAVTKARAALREAEEKIRCIKHWEANFDLVVGPFVKQIDGLRTVLEQDLPAAIALLANTQRALDEYSDRQPTDTPPTEPQEKPDDES